MKWTIVALLALASRAADISFPLDAGVLDVTQPPFGAVPDDGKDDTAAIQRALDAYPNGNRIVWLPRGTYHVSDTLNWPKGEPGRSDCKRTILQGQDRAGTILRLPDRLAAFQTNKAVLFTGNAPAQRFRNAVRNLTIDVGNENPGAEGARFNASNQGTFRDVTIRAGTNSGSVGLNLGFTAEIGPLLVKNVTVEGFEVGIRTADAINGITLEHITVRGQREVGIDNIGQVFAIRDLRSENGVTALRNGRNPYGGIDKGGMVTLVDAVLKGSGAATNAGAFFGTGGFYLRDITATGYRRVAERLVPAGLVKREGGTISEWAARDAATLFPSTSNALGLLVKETPDVPWEAPAAWSNLLAFGAAGDGQRDDSAALQRAIDSGARTVYLPAGRTFRIDGEVKLRGHVERLIGCEGRVSGTGTVVFVEGKAGTVVIERMSGFTDLRHAAARTLVIQHANVSSVTGDGSGDLFVEDVVGGPWRLLNPRQHVWARQLNVECADVVNIENRGATLWILGLKTERNGVKIETTAGGRTELLGAHIYATGPVKTEPLFRSVDAAVSYAGVAESCFNRNNYGIWVEETRTGETRRLASSNVAARTSANGRALDLFSGVPLRSESAASR